MSISARIDVGARHHDVVDAHVAQAEDVGEHQPALRAKSRRRRHRCRERLGDVLANGALRLQPDRDLEALEPAFLAALGWLGRAATVGFGLGFAARFGGVDRAHCPWSALAASRALATGVRIGDAERGQYSRFQPFHDRRLGIVEMIVADKMQKAMDYQMGKVVGRASSPGPPPRAPMVSRARTISPRSGPKRPARRRSPPERIDVGRLVLFADGAVERADVALVGEDHRRASAGRARRDARPSAEAAIATSRPSASSAAAPASRRPRR